MRIVSNMVLVAALCTPLFSACAAPSAMAAGRRLTPCPEQEGYPDCQNGYKVDPAYLTDYDYERARIQDLQARSELALDSGDAGAYAALFVEDGELDGPADVAKGRAAIRNAVLDTQKRGAQPTVQAGTTASPAKTRHVITSVVLQIDGNRATSTEDWIAVSEKDATHHAQMGAFGRYEDQFIKRNGKWLFSKRKVLDQAAS